MVGPALVGLALVEAEMCASAADARV